MDTEKRLRIKVGSLITVAVLEELHGCSTEVEEFAQLWPDGLTLRLKNLKKVVEEGLDVYWFATEIMSEDGRWPEWDKFKKLQEELLDGDKFDEDDDVNDQYCAALALWEIIKQRK